MSRERRERRFVASKGIGFRTVRAGEGADVFKAAKGASKFRERHPQLYERLVKLRQAERAAAEDETAPGDMFNYAGDI